ncbi:putative thiopurine S-methyltransferase [Saccoglossus kowalevskii]
MNTLVKYYDQLVASKGSDVSFLLPLCGKSHDMKWLADKGHNVVGAEFAELPCKVFFDEQGLKYDTTPMEGVSDGFLHKSDDGKIKFFQSDFFKFTKSHAGVFDVIWDRASLVAINKKDREKYVDKIISLLKPDGVCMLESLVYEGSFRGTKKK